MELLTASYLMTIMVLWISYKVYKWSHPKSKGKLPPGSTGLPYIGETIQFFTPYHLYDIPPFIKKRVKRYGSLFVTSIVGQKIVVSTDPEVNNFIFQQEDKIFECFYTDGFVKLLGTDSILAYHGYLHKYIKSLILRLVSPENLKANLLHEMDFSTRDAFQSWSSRGSVEIKEEVADMVFAYASKLVMSYDETKAKQNNFRGNFKDFLDGLISFPINIPGTAFHACLQGRKNAMKVITDAFVERQASPHKLDDQKDFLDYLIEEINDKDTILNQGVAADLVFVLLFATFETTSTSITMATKFLADNPTALEELTKEHQNILKNRSEQDTEITWKEYKSMTFTHMVINETVRLANIVPGIFRRVIKDVNLKGYTIPKGMIVMVSPSTVHLNSDKYEDPLAFNPWRWKGKELHLGSKEFMAFGGGVRLCVGADFAKLQLAVYLHYLVTKYRSISVFLFIKATWTKQEICIEMIYELMKVGTKN
ncbi:hypothetical protein DCAR_0728968 [Daucus carota subsp. sativus]|uniref:Cytochrome P450 n=1 Tax=Daucus carota subsp. sativus TaxID=79200 RepID=A0AAF0XN32_DAUCS|nr:hypothetical protein DCAR_0728968 [Daucus carota subsp. sativus]